MSYDQLSPIASKLSLARNISEIHQTPARATIVYTILLTTDIGPPQIHATKSKLKIPMLPQLRAPITVRISAILSIIIVNNLENVKIRPILWADIILPWQK